MRVFLVLCLFSLVSFSSGCSIKDIALDVDIEDEASNQDLIMVGFSQPGAESAWRVALTESVKEAFTEERGYRLIYKDAQSKQDNQIKDIRTFIQQGVDYIVLSPIVETGWNQVLEEAKSAGIPVIICDRAVVVSNESLYTAFAGSNFRKEGSTAISCIEDVLKQRGELNALSKRNNKSLENEKVSEDADDDIDEDVFSEENGSDEDGDREVVEDESPIDIVSDKDTFNIVHIQGTLGSSAQVGRTKALEEAVMEHENWNIIAQECGEFTKGKAREAMTNILSQIDGKTIDLVYCENDEEAFGVMAALNEAGLSYGTNGKIIIVSFDGQAAALSMCMSGQINIEVECNPLQGEYIYNIINKLQNGEQVPKLAYIDENYFMQDSLTPEFIAQRPY